MEDRDPGLARERTQLAWTRTAVSFAAVAVAILKADAAAGAVLLVLSAAVWVVGRLAAREDQRSRRPLGITVQRTLQLITVASTAVGLTALAIALLSPAHPVR